MKIRRLLAVVITITLTLVMLTGCTTFENFYAAFIDDNATKNVNITIGVYEPVTGSESKQAVSEIRGIQLAHEVYPNINGKIVNVVYGDNASDVYASETAIKNLFSYNPDVILGSYGSVYSLVAGQYVKDNKTPAIAITNLNPLVTKNNDYYYRVCYVDSNQGDILARYILQSEGIETAGVLTPDDNDAALAMTSAFTSRIEAETGNDDAITAYQHYKSGDKDFSEQLKAIRTSGVKYVLLPGDKNDAVNIIKQANKMNLNAVFLGGTEWSTDEFKKMIGDDASPENIAYVSFLNPDAVATEVEATDEMRKFLDAYHAKYGQDAIPDNNVALGYDAYLIAINAVSEAGQDPTGEDIKKVLDGRQTFQGISGDINFNHVGDPIKTAYISTLKDNVETLVYTVEPAL
ncbi:MAG: ABC transporter substrate-binding protein [Eubacterium sp.]|nr:ABC transporter substrate-binding protein [Candidatus Colimonas fimequi]